MNQTTPKETYDEDEIDLRELFATVKKHIKKILLFVCLVVSITLVYVLSIPNSYKSSTILAPQSQGKATLGGLSALAGMAGIDIGGGGEVDTFNYLNTILDDYRFNVYLIEKYSLDQRIKGNEQKFVFALGFRAIYDLFHVSKEKVKEKEALLFETYQKLKTMVSFSSDKKSGVMTLSVESPDRFLAQELTEIYLKEATGFLRALDMQDTDKKIEFYRDEMNKKDDVELKKNLATFVSSLIQKSVLSKSSEYYLVKSITKPEVSNIQDKTKPKRALILVVSCVTAFILGIFGVFLLEFLANFKKEH